MWTCNDSNIKRACRVYSTETQLGLANAKWIIIFIYTVLSQFGGVKAQ